MSDQEPKDDGKAREPQPGGRPLLDGSPDLGPYRLLSVLGEGGMGVVYLAEQGAPLRRRVAIKVLKLGMDTAQVVARFESERQALAVMDHPGIAKVFDSGVTAAGRPFFVMEEVRGTPITNYADVHRLSTVERLRLFMDVCAAVQHAHMKGVIHRDLKPSNVLVAVSEAGPQVKVIDFGIAKAIGVGLTNQTLVTQFGQVIGTPEYMSPEQAEVAGLDVDTRTDVYSLGVMLYELLVGARPFDLSAKAGFVLSHALRERDVERPSTKLTSLGETLDVVAKYRKTTPDGLRREVRGDLDWIILRALEKDRTRRYETANGLRLDIQRHIDHQPVLARPPSVQYRVGKFVRRNRAVVVAAGIAFLAVLGGAAASTVGFVQAVNERERAERSAATAERVAEFLVDLFSVSDPGEARGNTVTAREVLDRGADRISVELGGEPAIRARLMRVMGDVYGRLGLYNDAVPLLEQAVAAGEGSPDVPALERARAHERLGIMYRELGRYPEAVAAFERARALAGAEGEQGSAEFAVATRGLASVHMRTGRLAEAEAPLAEALAIQEEILGPDHLEVGITAGAMAARHLMLGEPDQAVGYLERALTLRERSQGPDHPEVAMTAANLGSAHLLRGDPARAEEAYRRALGTIQRVLDEDHPNHALVLNNLGEAVRAQGRLSDAEFFLLRALEIRERIFGTNHPQLTGTLHYLGATLRDQGRLEEAERHLRRSVEIYDAFVPEPDLHGRRILVTYAEVLRALERTREANDVDARLAWIDERLAQR
jgi:eukaryotic-like serine/threonine-protein kinase